MYGNHVRMNCIFRTPDRIVVLEKIPKTDCPTLRRVDGNMVLNLNALEAVLPEEL